MPSAKQYEWERVVALSPEIGVRIEGPALTQFYPAERVGVILVAIEFALMSSIRAAATDDLSKLELLARFPRRGSYLQELIPIWNVATNVAQLMPPLMPLIPDAIEQLKGLIDILRTVLPLFEAKEPPISVVNNRGTVLINSEVHVHIDQLKDAANVAQAVTDIATRLGAGLEQVSLHGGNRELAITQDDKSRLGTPGSQRAVKRLAKVVGNLERGEELAIHEPVEATVDILSFSKDRRNGTLIVVQSDELPTRRFKFDLADRPETKSAIVAMLESRVKVVCRVIDPKKLELLSVVVHPE